MLNIDKILKRSLKKEKARDKYFRDFNFINKDKKEKQDERRNRALQIVKNEV